MGVTRPLTERTFYSSVILQVWSNHTVVSQAGGREPLLLAVNLINDISPLTFEVCLDMPWSTQQDLKPKWANCSLSLLSLC